MAFGPGAVAAIPDDVIVNVFAGEGPPPGPGLTTLTLAVPCVAMSAAVICAVSCVALAKVVTRVVPFQVICEVEMKFAPVTVSVNAAPPTAALAGEWSAFVRALL